MPLISIILTSYNHAKFIGEAIESVINQTIKDWEMYIIDDASVDSSWDIINTYSDPRIKSIRNSENQGPIYAFNKLIFELAKGQFIAIHHSDDVWQLDKLEKQIDFLTRHEEIGAVFSDVLPIDERGVPLPEGSHIYCSIFNQPNRTRFEWLRYFFLNGNALCHPSILIRKQCYLNSGAYRDMLAQLPDFDMWIRLCFKHEIHVMKDKLVKFRVLDNEMNTSGSRPITRIRALNEQYLVLKQYQTMLSKLDLFKVFPQAVTYDRGDDTVKDYVLARVCLDSDDYFLRRLLAVEILFEVLNNPVQREAVSKNYGFTALEFIKITGQFDIFAREELSNLNNIVSNKDSQITSYIQLQEQQNEQISNFNLLLTHKDNQIIALNSDVSEKDNQIIAMENSTSWKLTKPIRLIGRKLK